MTQSVRFLNHILPHGMNRTVKGIMVTVRIILLSDGFISIAVIADAFVCFNSD